MPVLVRIYLSPEYTCLICLSGCKRGDLSVHGCYVEVTELFIYILHFI